MRRVTAWAGRARSIAAVRHHASQPAPPTIAVTDGAEVALESAPRHGLPVTFADICRAHARIKSGVRYTSCYRSPRLSSLCRADVYLKVELQQQTGSFKERGARNALVSLPAAAREAGVIAASAGNHALALADHGSQLGIPVTVVMPTIAPLAKVERCRELGANVVLHGDNIGVAREECETRTEWADLIYINGYDDPAIIAGAGTVGLEIAEQVPEFDVVVIPCGGGGLLAGMSLALKTLRPDCQVLSVEPENCPSFREALQAGAPVVVASQSTLADGLAVPRVGRNAFEIAREFTDLNTTVSEMEVAKAVLRCVELEKLTVEGGGVAALAAILPDGKLHDTVRGKQVVIPLCGGNIDVTVLGRVLERGLAADGRLVRCVVTVSDRPGGIAGLAEELAAAGASIKDIYHERAWLTSAIDHVQVQVVMEVTSEEHGDRVHQTLRDRYPGKVAWRVR
mmetsp:Transcript_34978/g.91572  ORF Transcript_34978/g.91572 Transcript_34978/m.91572 type:complete len:455 (+) Transcript_34978:33-1397(+)